jgi:prepilin signal peptidase PulO-like enzyme (type II secretory pathway)
MEEYFTVFADSFASFFSWFVPLSLPIAFFLIILEIVLGVAILLQYRMKVTTVILLVLMIFFTALTFFSAYTGKVTDCGCFGDAIPLTPWESFYKDIILMVFVMHLFWHRRRLTPAISEKVSVGLLTVTTTVSVFLGYYALAHLPFLDFRPYKVYNSIPDKMIPEEEPVLEYTFVKDGEEVTSLQYLMPEDGYEYVSSELINEKASTPKITDYQVLDIDGNDFTEASFTGKKIFLVMYDVSSSQQEVMSDVAALVNDLPSDIEVMAFTSSSAQSFENFRHEHQLAVSYYFLDATVLKAMIRSNPGILAVQNGIVLGKWHGNDTPTANEVAELFF